MSRPFTFRDKMVLTILNFVYSANCLVGILRTISKSNWKLYTSQFPEFSNFHVLLFKPERILAWSSLTFSHKAVGWDKSLCRPARGQISRNMYHYYYHWHYHIFLFLPVELFFHNDFPNHLRKLIFWQTQCGWEPSKLKCYQ